MLQHFQVKLFIVGCNVLRYQVMQWVQGGVQLFFKRYIVGGVAVFYVIKIKVNTLEIIFFISI